MMGDLGVRLSAYLDGALDEADRAEIERLLAVDPDLCAELADLAAADQAAKAEFARMLAQPIPLSLVRSLNSFPQAETAPPTQRRMPIWSMLAASVALVTFGAVGGYLWRQADAERDWIAEIGEYHGIYAAQTRHLVEVPGSEAAHIESWLAKNVGTNLPIPDLTPQGFVFEGGRLLVAAGKPVGQLMYRDADGAIVAICFIASDKPATDRVEPRDLGGFDGFVWGVPGLRILLIGPKGDERLPDLANAARSV